MLEACSYLNALGLQTRLSLVELPLWTGRFLSPAQWSTRHYAYEYVEDKIGLPTTCWK